MPYSTGSADGIKVYEKDASGYAIRATLEGGVPPTTDGVFAVGCDLMVLSTGDRYRNEGSVTVPSWVQN